jgi:hypothetical protein
MDQKVRVPDLQVLAVCHGRSHRSYEQPGQKWTYIDLSPESKADFTGNGYDAKQLDTWLNGRQFDAIVIIACAREAYTYGFGVFAKYLRRPGGILAMYGIPLTNVGYFARNATTWWMAYKPDPQQYRPRIDPIEWIRQQERTLHASVVKYDSPRWQEMNHRLRGLLQLFGKSGLIFDALPLDVRGAVTPEIPSIQQALQCMIRPLVYDQWFIYPTMFSNEGRMAIQWRLYPWPRGSNTDLYYRSPILLHVESILAQNQIKFTIGTEVKFDDEKAENAIDHIYIPTFRFVLSNLTARYLFLFKPNTSIVITIDGRSMLPPPPTPPPLAPPASDTKMVEVNNLVPSIGTETETDTDEEDEQDVAYETLRYPLELLIPKPESVQIPSQGVEIWKTNLQVLKTSPYLQVPAC